MSMSDQQRLETEIEAQREQLADTIDALSSKLDVKAHARAHRTELVAIGVAAAVVVVAWSVWKRGRT